MLSIGQINEVRMSVSATVLEESRCFRERRRTAISRFATAGELTSGLGDRDFLPEWRTVLRFLEDSEVVIMLYWFWLSAAINRCISSCINTKKVYGR